MSNNKQSRDHIVDANNMISSIEWYSNEIGKITALALNGKMTGLEWKYLQAKALEQAKAMRKQELIDFHVGVMKLGLFKEQGISWEDDYLPVIKNIAEQYYNETFNNHETN